MLSPPPTESLRVGTTGRQLTNHARITHHESILLTLNHLDQQFQATTANNVTTPATKEVGKWMVRQTTRLLAGDEHNQITKWWLEDNRQTINPQTSAETLVIPAFLNVMYKTQEWPLETLIIKPATIDKTKPTGLKSL